MRICFLFFGPQQPEIAKAMIASVREHMPNVTITQLADLKTKKLAEVDEIRRVDGNTYPFILYKHMATVPAPFIRVDYDMIFQGDITNILNNNDFAVNEHGDSNVIHSQWGKKYPLATCIWGVKKDGREIAEDFRRTHLESGRDDWMGLIPSANDVVRSGKYDVNILPGYKYNYCPRNREDKPNDALVLHYKGNRKHWMLPPEMKELAQADEQRVLQKVAGYDKHHELCE